MARLEIVGIGKSFRRVRVLEDLHLAVADGQLVVLLGASGCGKSTTLNIVGGLEEPDTGDVIVDGARVTDLPPNRRDMGMVFQSYALYPHMTVRQNLMFGLRVRGVERREAQARVAEIAETLEIDALLARKPAQLSGGQQQRVALGRALVRSPGVLLMDEPLSNLDAALRVRMRSEIRKLQLRLGLTTVFVTHDQEEAMSIGDAIAVMEDGRIRQLGAPMAVYTEPADVFVARFVGLPQMNLVEGALEGGSFKARALEIPVAAAARDAAVLGARPEALELTLDAEDGRTVGGRVAVIEPLGPETLVEVDTDVGVLTVRVGATGVPFRAGDTVRVRWPLDGLHVFDAATGLRVPFPQRVEAFVHDC